MVVVDLLPVSNFFQSPYIERIFMFMSKITGNLDTLVSKCQRAGPYYTAQTILGLIDDIMSNTRNMGYTVAFIKLKTKIKNTNVHQTSLKVLYKDVLNVINKYNMKSPEVMKLKTFIETLQQKSIY